MKRTNRWGTAPVATNQPMTAELQRAESGRDKQSAAVEMPTTMPAAK